MGPAPAGVHGLPPDGAGDSSGPRSGAGGAGGFRGAVDRGAGGVGGGVGDAFGVIPPPGPVLAKRSGAALGVLRFGVDPSGEILASRLARGYPFLSAVSRVFLATRPPPARPAGNHPVGTILAAGGPRPRRV